VIPTGKNPIEQEKKTGFCGRSAKKSWE
jgi:hypothetical protein